MMTIEVTGALGDKLAAAAARRAMAVEDLVAAALNVYLDSTEGNADAASWVRATQARLPGVWPVSDFGDWPKPHD